MTEAELQRNVIELAHLFGWRVAHFDRVPVKRGQRVLYMTPVMADGAGFPDLVLVRDRVIFAELKRRAVKSSVSDEQAAWHTSLLSAGAEFYLWEWSDWTAGTIEDLLRRRAA